VYAGDPLKVGCTRLERLKSNVWQITASGSKLIAKDLMPSPTGSFTVTTTAGPAGNDTYVVDQFKGGRWITVLRKTLPVLARPAEPVVPPPPPPPPPPDPDPVPPPSGVQLRYLATPSMPTPSVGSKYVDELVGAEVFVVSATHRARYCLTDAWNGFPGAESRIKLDDPSNKALFVGGERPFSVKETTIQVPNESMWSRTSPWIVIGSSGTRLVRVDIRVGGAFTTIKDFGSALSIGRYEGTISDDGGRTALDAGGRLMVWDLVANREVSSMPMPSVDGYQLSRDGKWLVLRAGNTRRYDADDLSKPPLILDKLANHGAVCLIDGVSYYVGNNAVLAGTSAEAGVVAYRLSDGKPTVLLGPNVAFGDGHTNGTGPFPVLSNYDATKNNGAPGRDQVVGVLPNGLIVPYSFAHHLTPDFNDAVTYARQPRASANKDGTMAIFKGWDRFACIAVRA
jgi:hypothetical protein